MNRFWIFLMIMAIVILIGVSVYELFASISGQNVEFSKEVLPIEKDLHQDEIRQFVYMTDNIGVQNKDLENK